MILRKAYIENCTKKITVLFLFVCMAAPAFSQDDKSASLAQMFTGYQQHNFQEKIFVHTDKTFYLAGETIWFKVYDVDAYFNMPSNISSICYLEIIGNDNKPVLQTKIGLEDGKGNGSFALPSSIESGNYQLRAYTNWMKNFSADFYFHQPITVVNTLKKFSTAGIIKKDTGAVIQFFPEGGNLVYGLPSRIAFKAVDKNGDGIDCNGKILDEENNAVASFQSFHSGMGNFMLTPLASHHYHAVLKINDTNILQDLPAIYNQGFVMNVTDNDAHTIKISVRSNYDQSNAFVYLFVQSHNLVKSVKGNAVTNGEAVFFIDKEMLGDGISQFTVFNQDKQPVCERLYFKRPVRNLVIDAKADQSSYSTRKKVAIDILSKDQAGAAVNAGMSMAVFQVDPLQPLQYTGIQDYLMLVSDLKGTIQAPEYYFNSSAEAGEAADNLMLTQGWRRFNWDDILQNKKKYFEFLPENEGPVVEGIITDKRTGAPAKDVTAYLSVPGDIFALKSTVSNMNGEIKFNPNDFYGKRELIMQTNNQTTDSIYRIDIANDYSDKFSSLPLPELELPNEWKNQLVYRHINVQADNSYSTEKKRRYYPLQLSDTTQFFGTPDKKYFLDEYTRFITMEEVMHEFVSDVRARKESGKFQIRLRDENHDAFFEDAPLVLLDGVPLFDADKIMAFDPLKIKKVEVVSRKFYAGSLVNDGILSLQTYNNDLGGYQLDANALVVEYDGLQREREFYAPVYETSADAANRLPDVRNMLFWSPDIQATNGEKKQLVFYTSDITGRFAVVVQGISATGLAGSTMFTFDVKN